MPPRRRRPTAAQKRKADEVRVRRARALYEARASLRPPEPEPDFESYDVDSMESELITETARELHRMGKLHSMLGAQALVIAREIVRGEGSMLATLSKEHSRLMAALAAGESTTPPPDAPPPSAPVEDPLDVAKRVAEEKRRLAAGGDGS